MIWACTHVSAPSGGSVAVCTKSTGVLSIVTVVRYPRMPAVPILTLYGATGATAPVSCVSIGADQRRCDSGTGRVAISGLLVPGTKQRALSWSMGTADATRPFGLGCVNLGSVGGRRGARLVHQALDLGVRFFDTADAYGAGASERVIGAALRGRRDRAFVATKAGYVFKERTALEHAARRLASAAIRPVGRLTRRGSSATSLLAGSSGYASQDFSARHLRTALEASLRRLDTDYIDL